MLLQRIPKPYEILNLLDTYSYRRLAVGAIGNKVRGEGTSRAWYASAPFCILLGFFDVRRRKTGGGMTIVSHWPCTCGVELGCPSLSGSIPRNVVYSGLRLKKACFLKDARFTSSRAIAQA